MREGHRHGARGRALALGAALLGASLVGALGGAEPAAAASVNFRVHQFNICGNSCYQGGNTPGDVVVFAVGASNPRPYIITLNEVCFNAGQLVNMSYALAGLGYEQSRIVTQPGGCDDASDYGNLVFMLGTQYGTPVKYWYPSQHATSPETRGAICRTTSGYFIWRGCSTHLLNRGTGSLIEQAARVSIANHQADELLFAFGGSGPFTVIGGDFNLHPTNIYNYSSWSSLFEENDEFAPYNPTLGSSKYDYVWAKDSGVGKINMSLADPGGEFDHLYLTSNFSKTL